MSDKPIRLSRNFKFFLTFHFSLGFSIAHADNQKDQLCNLEKIASKLNRLTEKNELRKYRWSKQKFDEKFPLSLRKKHGYLLGEGGGQTEELRAIINGKEVQSKCTEVELDSENIDEKVVYFDHGVGSINLTIPGKLKTKEAIDCLGALALSIQENIQNREKKGLVIFDNWDDFRNSARQAFEEFKDKKWDIKFLKDEDKKRGLTNFVGTGALFTLMKQGIQGSSKTNSRIKKKAVSFRGLAAKGIP